MVTIDAGSEWGVGGGTMCTRRVTRVGRGIRGPSAAPSPLLYPILDCTTAPARRVSLLGLFILERGKIQNPEIVFAAQFCQPCVLSRIIKGQVCQATLK